MARFFYFAPRILSILIILFWMSFVFLSHGLSFETLVESGVWAIILVVAILAWQGRLAGKAGFLILGIAYLILTKGRFDFLTYLLVCGPLFLAGVLFFLDKSSNNRIPAKLIKKPALRKEEPEEDEGII